MEHNNLNIFVRRGVGSQQGFLTQSLLGLSLVLEEPGAEVRIGQESRLRTGSEYKRG